MFARAHRRGQPNSPSVAAWALSLDKLLRDPRGVKTFAEYLSKEFSSENVWFWAAVEEYNHLTDRSKMRKMAKDIADKYVRLNSNELVNIDCHTRQAILSQLDNPTRDMFLAAQKEVFVIMQFDAYPRFLKSDLYTATLNAEKEGKPFPYTYLTAASASNSPTSGARYRSKSREKNRTTSSKKVNSASFISNSSSDLNAISDDNSTTPTRRSFLTYKKDMDAVWNRLQNRMDDQRGMELKCDMPEFLLQ